MIRFFFSQLNTNVLVHVQYGRGEELAKIFEVDYIFARYNWLIFLEASHASCEILEN